MRFKEGREIYGPGSCRESDVRNCRLNDQEIPRQEGLTSSLRFNVAASMSQMMSNERGDRTSEVIEATCMRPARARLNARLDLQNVGLRGSSRSRLAAVDPETDAGTARLEE